MKPITRILDILVVLSVILGGTPTRPVQAAPGDTIRVSVASDGTEGNNDSYRPSISADGRYVAFETWAGNLVVDDTNDKQDIFVHDSQAGTTTRVSVASDGTEGDDHSYSPSISADGRYVAFASDARNLVAGDTNYARDVFVYDLQAGTIMRVSVASDGTEGDNGSNNPSVSADGCYVAFDSLAGNLVVSDTNEARDIFVHECQTGTTTRVSVDSSDAQGNGYSLSPSISADGRYVAFESNASNLVEGDTNGRWDVFVHDRQTGTTTRVSIASDGTEGNDDSFAPSISAEGRHVAFASDASNLAAGDTNGWRDVFLHDLQTGATKRVSVASNGTQGNDDLDSPSISADGRYIAFDSFAGNLVANDKNSMRDIFMYDRQTGTVVRVSVASDGTEAKYGSSFYTSISADGRYVAFASHANNLVAGDTNDLTDVFVHENAAQTQKQTFRSQGANDGWILESSETSNAGGTLDSTATTFRLGDDDLKKQYRGILSFSTGTGLPDNAVITKVTLKVKKQGITGGGNPVTTFQGFMVDIKKGFFGTVALQTSDFQTAASKSYGPFMTALSGGWYSINLTSGKGYINKLSSLSGLTQIRLRFKLDDNNNAVANYLSLCSGNAGAASRPQLIIEYYVP